MATYQNGEILEVRFAKYPSSTSRDAICQVTDQNFIFLLEWNEGRGWIEEFDPEYKYSIDEISPAIEIISHGIKQYN